MQPFATIPGVLDARVLRGPEALADAAPDLLIEVPHGATRTEDYTDLASRLTSPLPHALIEFFYVNTDVGAWELAEAIAARLTALAPTRAVALLRCRIPRTFIDCNRRVDAAPEDFRAGRVTPGLMPWITTPEDRTLLRGLYDQYVSAVRAASDALAPDAAVLLPHSYAPRSVDVDVDAHIVANLRRAYEPDIEPTWPLRPMVDVICRDADGVSHAPAGVLAALRANLAALDVPVAESETYPMHPSTLAWDHVQRRPGRALCVEVRRDLLADPFDPFAEMRIGDAKVTRLADPMARALLAWW